MVTGKYVVKLRKGKGWTQLQLAEQLIFVKKSLPNLKYTNIMCKILSFMHKIN